MLIALLVLIGVDLVVIVLFMVSVVGRRRWIKRQPGVFQGAIRLAAGEIDGIGSKWTRGYGRWVRDVFVWSKAPFLFRNEVLAADALVDRRQAAADEVAKLGDHAVVVQVQVGAATVEVAARAEDVALLVGPYRTAPADVGPDPAQ